MPRRILPFLVAIICLALLTSATAKKTQQLVRVTVNVKNPDAAPVRNAGVILRQITDIRGHKPKHPLRVELKTDSDGNANIDLFEAGTVQVQVIAQGYQTWGGIYRLVKPDETINIRVAYPKDQISIYK